MRYPAAAGGKDPLSRENAEANARRFSIQQQRVLELFETGFAGTADDVARRLGMSILSARPRCSQLYKAGLLEHAGRKQIRPGFNAWILQLKTEEDDDGQPTEQQEWFDFDPDC